VTVFNCFSVLAKDKVQVLVYLVAQPIPQAAYWLSANTNNLTYTDGPMTCVRLCLPSHTHTACDVDPYDGHLRAQANLQNRYRTPTRWQGRCYRGGNHAAGVACVRRRDGSMIWSQRGCRASDWRGGREPEGVVALVGGAWVIDVQATSLSLSLHLIW